MNAFEVIKSCVAKIDTAAVNDLLKAVTELIRQHRPLFIPKRYAHTVISGVSLDKITEDSVTVSIRCGEEDRFIARDVSVYFTAIKRTIPVALLTDAQALADAEAERQAEEAKYKRRQAYLKNLHEHMRNLIKEAVRFLVSTCYYKLTIQAGTRTIDPDGFFRVWCRLSASETETYVFDYAYESSDQKVEDRWENAAGTPIATEQLPLYDYPDTQQLADILSQLIASKKAVSDLPDALTGRIRSKLEEYEKRIETTRTMQ